MPHPDFDAMQRQMFEQFQRTMLTMIEAFVALDCAASTSMREEFEKFLELTDEIESLRREPSRRVEVDSDGDRLDPLIVERAMRWRQILAMMSAK